MDGFSGMNERQFRRVFLKTASGMKGSGLMAGEWPDFTIDREVVKDDEGGGGDSCST